MPYGAMSGLSDFLGSFNKESNTIRGEEQQRADQDSQIEQKALEHLAASDDPEIRAAAVTAMLTPKKAGAGSGLMKWFGQQRSHPVFDQVNQLVGAGRQPFLSEEEKAAQHRAGTITGASRGAAQGMREEGMEPPPGMIESVVRGAAGSPQRAIQPKPGTVVMKDGTRQAATQQADGMFYDQYGGAITDEIAEWHPSGTGLNTPAADPNKHGAWTTFKGPDGKYYRQFTNAQGVRQGQPVETVAPTPPANPVFPNAGGGYTEVDTRNNRATNIPPPPGMSGRPEDPTNAFTALNTIVNEVRQRANATVMSFGGAKDPAELQTALDREAKVSGYQGGWQELVSALTAAQARVSGSVPPPPAPIVAQPPAPAPGAAPKAPAAKPGQKPAAPPKPGAKPVATAQPARPQIDINAVLAELNKFN